MHRTLRAFPAFALLLLAAAPLAAQTPPAAPQGPPPCTDPAFRAFDYWIGEWQVTGPGGAVAGSNVISAVSDGCGILERWTDSQGRTGTSINFYDRRSDRWNQVWVGAGGSILRLEGQVVDGAMQLGGKRPGPGGSPVIDRIRWIPAGDGTVRQHWEVSNDDGATWTTAFDGTYTRVSAKGR